MDMKQIVIVGVGGQGILMASRIFGHIALAEGLDVKVSEVHGMAQRGGSVITHVRMGESVGSPLVEEGRADLALSFERMEAGRVLPFLKRDGVLITSTQTISPMPVVTGAATYPPDILERLEKVIKTVKVDAQKLAAEAGSPRGANIVLLAAAAAKLPFGKQRWLDAIAACVPAATLNANLRAFEVGFIQ